MDRLRQLLDCLELRMNYESEAVCLKCGKRGADKRIALCGCTYHTYCVSVYVLWYLQQAPTLESLPCPSISIGQNTEKCLTGEIRVEEFLTAEMYKVIQDKDKLKCSCEECKIKE